MRRWDQDDGTEVWLSVVALVRKSWEPQMLRRPLQWMRGTGSLEKMSFPSEM